MASGEDEGVDAIKGAVLALGDERLDAVGSAARRRSAQQRKKGLNLAQDGTPSCDRRSMPPSGNGG